MLTKFEDTLMDSIWKDYDKFLSMRIKMTWIFGLISEHNKLTQVGRFSHLKYMACMLMNVNILLHFLS